MIACRTKFMNLYAYHNFFINTAFAGQATCYYIAMINNLQISLQIATLNGSITSKIGHLR